MANFVFITFLVASFCLIGSFADKEEAKQYRQVKKNALHQVKFAKVEIEKNIYQLVKEAKGKIKGDDTKLACADDAKIKAIEQSGTILAETVGRILPAIEKVDAAILTGDKSKVSEFLNNWNYPEYKKKEFDNFKSKMDALLPTLQAQLDKCVA